VLAIPALAAAQKRRDHDTVADLQTRRFRTDLDDLAHVLVADDVASRIVGT
jgi:hypothetical protein